MADHIKHFIPFNTPVEAFELPVLFTFPFYYEPHPLSILAANQLQEYLDTQSDWKHNFGLKENDEGLVIGKMFGVLVVQNQEGDLGYLAAFSGKLADSNEHQYFVPPVFDMLQKDGFFKTEELVVNQLNREIELIETNPEYQTLCAESELNTKLAEQEIADRRNELKEAKRIRKQRRETNQPILDDIAFEALKEELKQESLKQQYFLKQLISSWELRLADVKSKLAVYKERLIELKNERKQRSNNLQQRLFEQYQFLNANSDWKSLKTIFTEELKIAPPAGAGECAAPKLLHYAYTHRLKPIALAEFWWGQSPKSEIRKHKEFYPACRSKCEPILGHMLQGLEVEPNPMLLNPAEGKSLPIIFEDDHLLLVNKPEEFLSVPGKNVVDSVQNRIQQLHPEAVLVHRLDQSTSGIILVAKTKIAHQQLQAQFVKRTVTKRYVALLKGEIKEEGGLIDLPLRVDLDNRPHQLVCYQYGKPAQTRYEVITVKDGITKVHFYPITGRTHQLRVHASHPDGLNAAIIGDDLYGTRDQRLYLHAEYLEFTHPVTKNRMSFEAKAEF